MCEHKGVGHPDTLIDGLCEIASHDLSRTYLRNCGRVLHRNLDKGLLISATSAPHFGGGKLTGPMKVIICGKAIGIEGQIDPAASGDDYKIMSYRVNAQGRFIIVLAFIDKHVASALHYFSIKRKVPEYVGDHLSLPADIEIILHRITLDLRVYC